MISNPCLLTKSSPISSESCTHPNKPKLEIDDSRFSSAAALIEPTDQQTPLQESTIIIHSHLICDTIDQLKQLNQNASCGSRSITFCQKYPLHLSKVTSDSIYKSHYAQRAGREAWRLRIFKPMSGILEVVSYLVLLLLTLCSLCTASLCDPKSWWNADRHKCTPCTICEGDMIPLRPCQVHQDTVCGSIYDLKIDWVVLSRTEPNWKDVRGHFTCNIDIIINLFCLIICL